MGIMKTRQSDPKLELISSKQGMVLSRSIILPTDQSEQGFEEAKQASSYSNIILLYNPNSDKLQQNQSQPKHLQRIRYFWKAIFWLRILFQQNRFNICDTMSQVRQEEDREHEPLMSGASEKRRFPQVFKWKVATLIIGVLIVIFLITDIILLVDYNNSQPRSKNYTFLSDILGNTQNQQITRQNFINIAKGLAQSFPDIWFQYATPVNSWAGGAFNLDSVGSLIDGQADELFIMTFSDGTNNYAAAAYNHIAFSLPSTWQDYLNSDPKNHYYTFEITDRQSTILGGGSSTFLRMSGSTANLLNCLVIDLFQSSVTFLNMLKIDFANPTPNFIIQAQNSACFDGQPDTATALSNLQTILGLATIPPTLTLLSIESYDLSA